jgi:hypothetical protein
MKKYFVMLAVVLLSGCGVNPVNTYAGTNRPLAEQGVIKWSDYYKGLYSSVANSNTPGRGRTMARANVMIMAAISYEAGSITRDQFEYLRRDVQAGEASDSEQAAARRNAALTESLRSWSESRQRDAAADPGYQIVRPKSTTTDTTCRSGLGQVNCTSVTN